MLASSYINYFCVFLAVLIKPTETVSCSTLELMSAIVDTLSALGTYAAGDAARAFLMLRSLVDTNTGMRKNSCGMFLCIL